MQTHIYQYKISNARNSSIHLKQVFIAKRKALAFGQAKFLMVLLLSICPLTCWANAEKSAITSSTPKTQKTIVALAPHIVEMLYDIGAGEQIIGTVSYADHPKEALKIPRIGGYHGMQVEKLLALQPDIIIAWKTGNKLEDLEKLKRLNLPVFFSEPKDVADVANELRYFGELTGRSEKAEIVAQKFEKRLKAIKETQHNKTRLKTFYQLWSAPMMSINNKTWIHQLLDICRADNVFANSSTSYPQISIENVMLTQPEVIVIPNEKSKKVQPKIDWKKWPEIPAVKKNQLITVNADLLHRYSTRMLDGLEDMCDKIDKFR